MRPRYVVISAASTRVRVRLDDWCRTDGESERRIGGHRRSRSCGPRCGSAVEDGGCGGGQPTGGAHRPGAGLNPTVRVDPNRCQSISHAPGFDWGTTTVEARF